MNARMILTRAAALADRYDRAAKGDVRRNLTDAFHLCGLIERAASVPRSGSTHRRSVDSEIISEAKAVFCRAYKVPHPSVWEWESRRSCEEVARALHRASEVAGQ